MTTRSTTILVGIVPAARGFLTFECPPTEVALVKSAFVQNRDNAVRNIQIWVNRPSEAALVELFHKDMAVLELGQWQGWLVLEPGDEITAYADGPNCACWISGTQLPAAPQIVPPAGAAAAAIAS